MSKKTLIIFVAVFSLSARFSALAQSPQNIPSVPPQTQQTGSSELQNSSIDGQGNKRYRVGPGDLLDVRVFGQPDLNSTVEIDEDGNITSLPFVEDPIPAKCRNEKEIQKAITRLYARYIITPRVSVRVLERRSRPPAVIFGAVRAPTRVQMMRRVRLHELLALSGGITSNASGTIQIMHTERELCPETDDLGDATMALISDREPAVDKTTATQKPLADQAVATQKPAVDKTTATQKPLADQPVATEKPAVDKTTATQKPLADQPVATQKPAVDKTTATQKPVTDQVVATQKPAVDKTTATQKPVTDQVVATQKPTADNMAATQKPATDQTPANLKSVADPQNATDPDRVAANSGIGELEIYQINTIKTGGVGLNVQAGGIGADPYIRPGDIVIVTEGLPIYITGAVVQPGPITMKDQMTLLRAIAMVGGLQKLAKGSQVHIYRQKEGKLGQDDMRINYDAIKNGKQPDIMLQAYDIIDVRMQNMFSPKSMADFFMGISKGMVGSLPMRVVY